MSKIIINLDTIPMKAAVLQNLQFALCAYVPIALCNLCFYYIEKSDYTYTWLASIIAWGICTGVFLFIRAQRKHKLLSPYFFVTGILLYLLVAFLADHFWWALWNSMFNNMQMIYLVNGSFRVPLYMAAIPDFVLISFCFSANLTYVILDRIKRGMGRNRQASLPQETEKAVNDYDNH